MEVKRAITVGRVSSDKQLTVGDSFDEQENQIRHAISKVEQLKQIKIDVIKQFQLTGSANVELERQPLAEAITYAVDPKNRIEYVFIKSIDRATRAGALVYGILKSKLTRAGITLVDGRGMINSQRVNTLATYDMQFPWSVYDPSLTAELLEAERANGEVRDILSRLIGSEINYTRKGYRMGQTNYGYRFELTDTDDGRRKVLVPEEKEAFFIKRIFDLRGNTSYTDEQIVNEINKLGYKSRTVKLRDQTNLRKVIGLKGGKALTKKQLQRIVSMPIYCGVITHKWLKNDSLKKSFEGIVSIDAFNKANKGKYTLISDGAKLRLITELIPEWQLHKNKDNPKFPYKQYVCCPFCHGSLYGSASRSKSGKHIPRYHCNRNHKYFSVNKAVFDNTIKTFVERIHFSSEFLMKFRKIMLEEWEKRRIEVQQDNISLSQQLEQIEVKQKQLMETIKIVSSPLVIAELEQDIEQLENDRLLKLHMKDKKEEQKIDIQVIMNYVTYFLEHLDKLILSGSDPLKSAQFFSLLFTETPTYEELAFGTPKLSLIFELNEAFKKSEELMVDAKGLEPLTPSV